MDSLHDEDVLFMKLHHIAFEILASVLEVKARKLHLFTCKQIIKLGPQKFQIHCSERLEVIFSILVTRSELPVYKVVVQLDDAWIQAEDAALESQSL